MPCPSKGVMCLTMGLRKASPSHRIHSLSHVSPFLQKAKTKTTGEGGSVFPIARWLVNSPKIQEIWVQILTLHVKSSNLNPDLPPSQLNT